MKFILGQKLGMSQIFDEKGNAVSVTLIEAGPCKVTQIKTKEKDDYQAVQIGFTPKTKKTLRQAQGGESRRTIKKTEKGKEFKYLREFQNGDHKVGDEISASIFQEGDKVKISGTSKGKGFAGAVKRWGFKGRLSATHGTKHELRTLGSVGTSFPERVIKGKKMSGRMGSERVTIKNLKVVKVDSENNILAVAGAIPGSKGTLLEISNS
ncbi:MAG: 50S ribosomal protein L3 [Parcubacteria group bacterium CG1_02_39_15]|uniref:Large ribosomal subunit protein uL3 n=3 Tax=Candidatus Nealsoniibacteriota TaxID=1817911 RepID=A0A2G9YSH1_9BACT|nr:MAG: 50S ribosomal protein L3 [Parcubacteria group bacterium CG1_02_39_15]PIP22186.1 MAG: 50S ribosomal protein L3 [Candidatus Nealsonbacteria bacterium CG23_combo_of_CG06-09_8_20_14_all_39_25]PIW90071.1 MAG: 50S ribosomal protein L3 [Candidatus Nealsonbacteria bacterium CG_4_8_14_3_um_filter_40_11]PIZ88352.1 MAG: 50S ribosomal protein L3 [Candidatus Nealsonbacteria bacterium CG_4_10_14_0_2_um_filter_39_15]